MTKKRKFNEKDEPYTIIQNKLSRDILGGKLQRQITKILTDIAHPNHEVEVKFYNKIIAEMLKLKEFEGLQDYFIQCQGKFPEDRLLQLTVDLLIDIIHNALTYQTMAHILLKLLDRSRYARLKIPSEKVSIHQIVEAIREYAPEEVEEVTNREDASKEKETKEKIRKNVPNKHNKFRKSVK